MKRIILLIYTETMFALWKLDVLRIQAGKPKLRLWHLSRFAPASQSYRAVLVEIGRQAGIAQARAVVDQAVAQSNAEAAAAQAHAIRAEAAVTLARPPTGKRANDG